MEKYGFQITTPEGVEVFISSNKSYTQSEAISLAIEALKQLPAEGFFTEIKD